MKAKLMGLVLLCSQTLCAASFNCAQVVWNERALSAGMSSQSNFPLSLEMALAVAIYSIRQVDHDLADQFRERAFKALNGVDIVDEQKGFLVSRFKMIFPSRTPYAARSRNPLSRSRQVVWPKTKEDRSSFLESALFSIKLIFEIESLNTLPPNTVRFLRYFRTYFPRFVEANSESLMLQYAAQLGFMKKLGTVVISNDHKSWRWRALFKGRSSVNPFFHNLVLNQTMALQVISEIEESDNQVEVLQSARRAFARYLQREYGTPQKIDRLITAACTATAAAGLSVAGMLTNDLGTALEGIPRDEIRVTQPALDDTGEPTMILWEERSDEELESLLK